MLRTCAIVLAVAVACVACGSSEPPVYLADDVGVGSSHVWDEPTPIEPIDGQDLLCSDMIVKYVDYCYVVNVDNTVYRYGFAPAGFLTDPSSGPIGRAVIVDSGGPGSSALSGGGMSTLARNFLVGDLNDFDLIVIEEPWVMAEIGEECSKAMTEFYMSFRLNVRENPEDFEETRRFEAAKVVGECRLNSNLWGLSPDVYGKMLSEIESRHHTKIVGFVGASFGSVRWAYADPERFEFTVLIRPFPVGVDMDTLMQRRGDIIAAKTEKLSDIVLTGELPENRSLPIEPSDVVAARVVAAAQDVAPSTESEIGRLSDGLWQRFGETSISPALLAYWQETCAHIGTSSGGHWNGTPNDVLGYLKSFHQVCDNIPKRSLPIPLAVSNVCVVVSQNDTVVPAQLSRPVFEVRGATVVVSDVSSHSSLDGLRECLGEIDSSRTPKSGESIASDDKHEVVGSQPPVTGSEAMVDAARLGWEVIEESDCGQQGDGYRWDVELGPGLLSTASVVVVTRAEEDSLVAMLYQSEGGESLEEGWLTSARSPHYQVETLPDGSLLVVEGVPGGAVELRSQRDSSDLAELDLLCWGQRWDRRVTGEELSDVDILYGDAAMVRLVRDRAAGAPLVADAQYSNVYRYTSDQEDVVLVDLRPRAVVMLTAYHEHPLPELDELVELVGR